MNPIMAITLNMEKIYSASPYPLTPNMLIVTIITKKIVTKILRLIFNPQYSSVSDAAMISSGSTDSHWIA